MTDPESTPTAPARRSQRTALTILGLIGAIAIGFGLGFLAHIPLDDSDSTAKPGPVDIGFSQDMTVHHNQAIEMAAIELTTTTDPQIKNLAYDILTTQQNQVGQMQGWLSLWGEAALPTDGYMGWMSSDSAHGHDGMSGMPNMPTGSTDKMPGMATSDDMAALRNARGQELDVKFLQLMLRHHQGGLSMMQYGAQHADVSAVRELAETMVATQQNEAKTMTEMLTARGAAPLPMN
ncbi:DUF305 domain-containing protein [Antrihabitans cavernicola]|uniref:DUF305 domain-containing protein n=1 Tax=Antrihabitans cavernicola TaxID=2495913 RepID=A0A5A7S6M7_9NOCA|nr:DUF305 domain-containing protein [Spelaeibacter cavernicola]KAA0018064.1 DUF305 domain-containing protein [Spelaeibacter cavernicola]